MRGRGGCLLGFASEALGEEPREFERLRCPRATGVGLCGAGGPQASSRAIRGAVGRTASRALRLPPPPLRVLLLTKQVPGEQQRSLGIFFFLALLDRNLKA